MNLKPQDVLFLLKLIALNGQGWSFNKLSVELGMSSAEVHATAKRSLTARLAVRKETAIVVHVRNLEEFLLQGIQYVFVPERGGLTRGLPTAHGAEPLASLMMPDDDPPPVWPDPEGQVRGESFSPLYASVPVAAKNDAQLYELLVLVDSIRGGRVRERALARKLLMQRLEVYAP